MAVTDGGGADQLVRPALGVALPDHPGAVRPLERDTSQAAQDADRLGAAGHSPDQTLASRPPTDLCCRQRLCRGGVAGRGAPPCLCDHPPAAGCCFVQASPAAPEGPARSLTAEGQPPANAQERAGQQEDRLDARDRLSMVQCSAAHAADRHRHRTLVQGRCCAGANPLGAGARSDRRTPTGSVSQHRPDGNAGYHPRLVRLALARGNHIPRGSQPPRRGNPASVVRPRHPAHHPGTPWPVLSDHPVGRRSRARNRRSSATECHCLVPQERTNF